MVPVSHQQQAELVKLLRAVFVSEVCLLVGNWELGNVGIFQLPTLHFSS